MIQKSTNAKRKHISIKYEPSLLRIVSFFVIFFYSMTCWWIVGGYDKHKVEKNLQPIYFISTAALSFHLDFLRCPFGMFEGFFQQFVAFLCLTAKLLRPRLGLVSNKLKQMHINRQSLFYFSCSCSLPITLQRSSLSRYSEVGGSGFNLF